MGISSQMECGVKQNSCRVAHVRSCAWHKNPQSKPSGCQKESQSTSVEHTSDLTKHQQNQNSMPFPCHGAPPAPWGIPSSSRKKSSLALSFRWIYSLELPSYPKATPRARLPFALGVRTAVPLLPVLPAYSLPLTSTVCYGLELPPPRVGGLGGAGLNACGQGFLQQALLETEGLGSCSLCRSSGEACSLRLPWMMTPAALREPSQPLRARLQTHDALWLQPFSSPRPHPAPPAPSPRQARVGRLP